MYYRWTFMPAGKERSRSLALIASRGKQDYTDRDLYTFGVYTGESLKFWLERLAALGVTHGPMWGFDSYEGLPAEAEGKALESNVWLPGTHIPDPDPLTLAPTRTPSRGPEPEP